LDHEDWLVTLEGEGHLFVLVDGHVHTDELIEMGLAGHGSVNAPAR
jgi:hypothetical protein